MNSNAILFEPVRFGSVVARNRVVMAPMVTNFATESDEITDRQVSYYAERARGGAGTIVVEASPVRREARISSRQIGSYEDRFLPGLARLAESIRGNGSVVLLQLCHGGPKMWPRPGVPTESVSSIPVREGDIPRELSTTELRQVQDQFVSSARRAKQAGFDGIELHAAHLYLLSASLSPFTNNRTDEYGGSTRNRARLTREILEEIKAEVGSDWPVWVRMHGGESLEPGLGVEECQEIAGVLVEAGADAVHVSAYTLPINKSITSMVRIRVGGAPTKETPPGALLKYAAAIKRAVTVPVIAVGKLDDPALAASAVAEGECDMVALARQLLCDPYWPRKVESGEVAQITHCSYCMTCHTAQQRGKDVRCSQNRNLFGAPSYSRRKAQP
jgi:2,4-dienoyl-CoA reductase-like NADH-dependent reductase (Old Yellow Enzyme family)